ncbi:hypothetical protein GCM10007028_03190 [Algibacter mikhailovii]|uniref:Uncharacterized protein n=1 Tax=Algibacter mikhailovii TaxID=425498 RepID=A0A918V555_9FLAO|nr:hypothetical protein GCM10007028_03190 [Algibacter mikhailovii]
MRDLSLLAFEEFFILGRSVDKYTVYVSISKKILEINVKLLVEKRGHKLQLYHKIN